MVNHGLSTGLLFFAIGMLYERTHTRDMGEMGGLATITPWIAAEADDVATRVVLDGLRDGTLLSELGPLPDLYAVGVGHSMGSCLSVVQQARHAPHAAIVLLSFTTRGLPDFLTGAERAFAELGAIPSESRLSHTFLQRIAILRANPPGSGWDGAFTFETK